MNAAPTPTPVPHASGPDPRSGKELLPIVYAELRRLAQERLGRERPDHTLGAAALVHEAFLRIVGDRQHQRQNRAQFFAAAAEAMRRILIDHARSRARRGCGRRRVTLAGIDLALDTDPDQVLAIDEAFQRLEQQCPRTADVVRMRFNEAETAAALGLSERSVRREWS